MYNQTYELKKRFSPQALKVLLSYEFPGNIRELRNIINSAVLMSEKNVLEKSIVNAILDLKLDINTLPTEEADNNQSLKNQLSSLEKKILTEALARYRSTREVANYLNLSQSTVVRKMKLHGIMPE